MWTLRLLREGIRHKITQLGIKDSRPAGHIPRSSDCKVWALNHHIITPETQLKSTFLSLLTISPIFPTFRISTLPSTPPFFKNIATWAHQSLSAHSPYPGGPGSYTLRDVWLKCYNFKLNTFLGSSSRGSHLPVMGERAGLCI